MHRISSKIYKKFCAKFVPLSGIATKATCQTDSNKSKKIKSKKMEGNYMNQDEQAPSHEENHEKEKKAAFESQQGIMDKIREMGFARYAETLPNLKDAFDLEKHQLGLGIKKCGCCMDEGTPWGVHGALQLLSDEEFDEWFQKNKPTHLSGHDGCGAEALLAKKLVEEDAIDPDVARGIAARWIETKATKYGVGYVHIPKEEMKRPDFHDARVCYVDATGRFNCDGVEGLPKGFIVTHSFSNFEPTLLQAGVAEAIIFGDHGFGNDGKFLNEENKFVFVPIADSWEELEKMKDELSEFKFANSLGKEIAIDGFVAPKIG
jgi:hypothetical protein